jgi:Raf kinase inhibitor-like YbhB/YbcL family protein
VRRPPGASGRLVLAVAGLAAPLLLISGCALIGGGTTPSDVPDQMTVTSPDFGQGLSGVAFSCRGSGKHPVIYWSGAPRGTKSFALVMDDAAAPITPYIYWIVFNIGPQSSDIPAGKLPPGAEKAVNSKGTTGYDPPCPSNHGHGYRFTVYALNKKLAAQAGSSVKTAWTAIAASAIARGSLPAVIDP